MLVHVGQASFKQSLLVIGERIIIVKPALTIEFCKLHPDLEPFCRREFWKLFKDFGLTHVAILTYRSDQRLTHDYLYLVQ